MGQLSQSRQATILGTTRKVHKVQYGDMFKSLFTSVVDI